MTSGIKATNYQVQVKYLKRPGAHTFEPKGIILFIIILEQNGRL